MLTRQAIPSSTRHRLGFGSTQQSWSRMLFCAETGRAPSESAQAELQEARDFKRPGPTHDGKWRTASFQIRDWWKDVIGEYRTRCRGNVVRFEAETQLKQVMLAMVLQLLDPKAIEDSRRSCSDRRAALVTVEMIFE